MRQFLGEAMRAFRLATGIPQEHSPRPQSYVSKLERGSNSPRVESLAEHIEALGGELHIVIMSKGREFARVTPDGVIYAKQRKAG